MSRPRRFSFLLILFGGLFLNSPSSEGQVLLRNDRSSRPFATTGLERQRPGFLEARIHNQALFLAARNEIKREYIQPCGMVVWTGAPERFFSAETGRVIRDARPQDLRGSAMQLGMLVKGDLNTCRQEQGLAPIANVCRGGEVPPTPKFSAKRADRPRWLDALRVFLGRQDPALYFYEPCAPFPRHAPASRCPSSPGMPQGVQLEGSDLAERWHSEDSSMKGSPIGPQSRVGSPTGRAAAGGDEDTLYLVFTIPNQVETREDLVFIFDQNDDGELHWDSTYTVGIHDTGDYFVTETLSGEGIRNSFSRGIGGGNVYTGKPSERVAWSIVEEALRSGEEVEPPSEECDDETCATEVDGQGSEEEEAQTEPEEAGMPMCDAYASSEGCGGEYTFASLPLGQRPPLPPGMGPDRVVTGGATDCPPDVPDCGLGGPADPSWMPGGRILISDPLAPWVNPAFETADGQIGSLPCGMLEYAGQNELDDECLDPMNPSCTGRFRQIGPERFVNPAAPARPAVPSGQGRGPRR